MILLYFLSIIIVEIIKSNSAFRVSILDSGTFSFRLRSSVTISTGEAIEKSLSISDLLAVGQTLVRRGDEKLHYQKQLIHQRRRQADATNILKKMVKFVVGSSPVISRIRSEVAADPAFAHVIFCAFDATNDAEDTLDAKDCSNYFQSLRACAILYPQIPPSTNQKIFEAIRSLEIYAASQRNKGSFSVAQFDGLFWISCRLGYYSSVGLATGYLSAKYQELQLPFKVFINAVSGVASVSSILKEVPFKAESLVTMNGKRVTERRETCFMAEEGVGGLAYSGKIMQPQPFSPLIAEIRDRVHAATGIYFDCCLLNLYRDGECACAYHSDPDMGTIWAKETAVVSLGETRRFHLRLKDRTKLDPLFSLEEQTHCFHVFDGDIFFMFDDCQDVFEHAVLKSEGPQNNDARVSIVFKKSLPRLGGRRGHGVRSSSIHIDSNVRKPIKKSQSRSRRG